MREELTVDNVVEYLRKCDAEGTWPVIGSNDTRLLLEHIDALRAAQQAKVPDDVVRLDFIISKGARVMSDQRDESPACYWLRWEEEEESEQNGSYPSPREAIDAAMRDSAMLAAQSAQEGKV